MGKEYVQTKLGKRYEALGKERGAKNPRGWDPGEIANDFAEDVGRLESVLTGAGPFYAPDEGRKLLPTPLEASASGELKNTLALAGILAGRPRFKVDRRRALDFHYVDREIVAARALDKAGRARYQARPVKLDLLLVNAEDSTPIICEAKIKHDKDPEAGLLQGLYYATLMAPRAQRERLPAAYPDLFRHGVPKKVDVYVVLHRLPKSRKAMLDSALHVTAGLAPELRSGKGLGRYVRQIVFLEAYLRRAEPRFRRVPSAPVPESSTVFTS